MDIQCVDYGQADRAERFCDSLRHTGFVVLTHHPIPKSLLAKFYEQWGAFFRSSEKQDYRVDQSFSAEGRDQDGYIELGRAETAKGNDVQDIKEYYHYYPNGRVPETLNAVTSEYYSVAHRLASQLLEWVHDDCPLEVSRNFSEPLPQMIEGARNLLRILYYPPLSGAEAPGALRAAPHEDINLLTVLPTSNEPGLEVRARNGQWVPVPVEQGGLVVNIGDMLQEASGGYYPSTTHRVRNPEGENRRRSRISAPLFLGPRHDVVLSERYTAGAYLKERIDEIRARPQADGSG